MKWKQSVFFAPGPVGCKACALNCLLWGICTVLSFPLLSPWSVRKLLLQPYGAGTWPRLWHSPETGSPPSCILCLPLSLSAPSLVTYPVFAEHKLRARLGRSAAASRQCEPQDSGPAWGAPVLPSEAHGRWAERAVPARTSVRVSGSPRSERAAETGAAATGQNWGRLEDASRTLIRELTLGISRIRLGTSLVAHG